MTVPEFRAPGEGPPEAVSRPDGCRPGRPSLFGRPDRVKRLTPEQAADKGLISPTEAAQLLDVDVAQVAELAARPNGLGLRWVQFPRERPRPMILRRGVIRMRDESGA